MLNGKFVNWAVCLSNFVFGIPIFKYTKGNDRYLLGTMILASALMHISETKHNLPGIYPFNKWSWYFLNLDRGMALSITLYVLYYFNKGMPIPFKLGIIGLICLGLSEKFEYGLIWFMINHSIWHYCAFTILGLTFDF